MPPKFDYAALLAMAESYAKGSPTNAFSSSAHTFSSPAHTPGQSDIYSGDYGAPWSGPTPERKLDTEMSARGVGGFGEPLSSTAPSSDTGYYPSPPVPLPSYQPHGYAPQPGYQPRLLPVAPLGVQTNTNAPIPSPPQPPAAVGSAPFYPSQEAAVAPAPPLAPADNIVTSQPAPPDLAPAAPAEPKAHIEPALAAIRAPTQPPAAAPAPPMTKDEIPVTPEILAARHAAAYKANRDGIKVWKTAPKKRDVDLVPTSALGDDGLSALFRFPAFNAMQSVVFPWLWHEKNNVIVAAPTSSGKTTVFELAYVRMINDFKLAHGTFPFTKDEDGLAEIAPLAIYMAPTKALCNERAKDWSERFGKHGLCMQVTGDTGSDFALRRQLPQVTLLVVTPEKFDSMTRNKATAKGIWDRLQLFMIDEVHIISETRGATVEVIVSRARNEVPGVRFVAVPNICDISQWLGSRHLLRDGDLVMPRRPDPTIKNPPSETRESVLLPPQHFRFDEEYRPVPLTRKVYGFVGTDWTLPGKYNKKLAAYVKEHSSGKPSLIFCATRKACSQAAAALFADLPRPQTDKRDRLIFHDSQLTEWAERGVSVHHAGIDPADRDLVETGFRDGKIKVLVATSTLSCGVNLPARLVIIRGTQMYQGALGWRDYTDIEVQQMMGRAGRPQYDTQGSVVVMCETSRVQHFRNVVQSNVDAESNLWEHLVEHILSEIGLGTITSTETARAWLQTTFLYIRVQKNPTHYSSIKSRQDGAKGDGMRWLEECVDMATNFLIQSQLVERVNEDDDILDDEDVKNGLDYTLKVSDYGSTMNTCCVSHSTITSIMKLDPNAEVRDCLEVLSGAHEFADLRIRPGEAGILNKLNNDPQIRWRLDDGVRTYADKVFLLLQARFANVALNDEQHKIENQSMLHVLRGVMQQAPRIAKAILYIMCQRRAGHGSRSALELLHTINGKAWEDHAAVFSQIPRMGPQSIRVLAGNGIKTWEDLFGVTSAQLEAWVCRKPPYGQEIKQLVEALPRYQVAIEQDGPVMWNGQDRPPQITVRVTADNLGLDWPFQKNGKIQGSHIRYTFSVLAIRSDGVFGRFASGLAPVIKKQRGTDNDRLVLNLSVTAPDQYFYFFAGPDEISGMQTEVQFKPDFGDFVFPDRDWTDWNKPENPHGLSERTRLTEIHCENLATRIEANLPKTRKPRPKTATALPECPHDCPRPGSCGHDCCLARAQHALEAGAAKHVHVDIDTGCKHDCPRPLHCGHPCCATRADGLIEHYRSLDAGDHAAAENIEPSGNDSVSTVVSHGGPVAKRQRKADKDAAPARQEPESDEDCELIDLTVPQGVKTGSKRKAAASEKPIDIITQQKTTRPASNACDAIIGTAVADDTDKAYREQASQASTMSDVAASQVGSDGSDAQDEITRANTLYNGALGPGESPALQDMTRAWAEVDARQEIYEEAGLIEDDYEATEVGDFEEQAEEGEWQARLNEGNGDSHTEGDKVWQGAQDGYIGGFHKAAQDDYAIPHDHYGVEEKLEPTMEQNVEDDWHERYERADVDEHYRTAPGDVNQEIEPAYGQPGMIPSDDDYREYAEDDFGAAAGDDVQTVYKVEDNGHAIYEYDDQDQHIYDVAQPVHDGQYESAPEQYQDGAWEDSDGYAQPQQDYQGYQDEQYDHDYPQDEPQQVMYDEQGYQIVAGDGDGDGNYDYYDDQENVPRYVQQYVPAAQPRGREAPRHAHAGETSMRGGMQAQAQAQMQAQMQAGEDMYDGGF